jgi:hypothetical protein
MLDRIRKLLAQAQHKNTGEAESEAFTAKAQALIAQYGFEEAELSMNDPKRHGGQIGHRIVECHAPFASEKVLLFSGVGKPMGLRFVQEKVWKSGKPYRETRADKQVVMLHIFGAEADIERAELLYTSLLLQQSVALRKAVKQDSPEHVSWHGQTAWNRSWLVAYANRIYRRILDAEKAARAETMTKADGSKVSTSLVLASKDELIQAKVSESFPHTRKVKSGKRSGTGGWSGDAAGRRADLGHGKQFQGGRMAIG